jgi:enoyl-CoA hydratase
MTQAAERDFDDIVVDRVGTDGRVARVTLNRPDKLNALSVELLSHLRIVLMDLEEDFDARVIILRGAGRAFSAGYDLAPPDKATADAVVRGRQRLFDDNGRRLFMGTRTGMQHIVDTYLYFWNMAKVTVAELHGFALAGGCELAMMADLVVAAEDTQIGHPGVRFATSRTGVMWPLVIGMRKAKELYYTGSPVTGKQAVELGMINYAWAADELEQRTIDFADRMANLPSDHLAILKQSMNRFYENMGLYSSLRSAVDFDAVGSQHTSQAYAWRDKLAEAAKSGEGIKAAFDWRDGPYGDYRARKRQSAE